MKFNIDTIASTALAFATLGSSHMLITRPIPYGRSTLNTSPLNNAVPGSSDSDYPCKQRPGVYDITEMNHITVGEPQELAFEGSASHGGGTCQLTITKDQKPTVDSVFKIIQVFEGGCPIDSNGNSGSHPFTWVVPKDMPNGVMTFGWFWYNRIGDRELYMNCAPVTISGGSDNDTYFNSLPNVYLINMPTTQCQSTFEFESNAVTIPHPGQFIMKETNLQQMHAATGPNCSAKAAAQLDGVVGYKSDVITTNGAAYKAPAGAPPVPTGSGAASAAPASAAPSGSAPAGSGSVAPSSAAASGSAPAGSGSPASGSAAPSGSAPPASGSAAAGSAAAGNAAIGSGSAAPSSAAASGSAPAGSGSAAASGSAPVASGSAPAASGSAPASGSVPASGSAPAASGSAPAGSGSAAASAAPSGSAPAAISGSGAASAAAPSGQACSVQTSEMTCSSDGKQFGVCVDGKVVFRAVAPGTKCVKGQIEKRSVLSNPHVRRHARQYMS